MFALAVDLSARGRAARPKESLRSRLSTGPRRPAAPPHRLLTLSAGQPLHIPRGGEHFPATSSLLLAAVIAPRANVGMRVW
jgi:hypothetical protein